MIKVSVLYPNGEGKTFDMEYYLGTHIPMVMQLLGDACKKGAAEQGIAGGAPGSAPPILQWGICISKNLKILTHHLLPTPMKLWAIFQIIPILHRLYRSVK
jgi:hypothetical protein